MIPVLTRPTRAHRNIATAGAANAYDAQILAYSSLVRYLPLQETTGITATDAKNGVNGTYTPNSGGAWTGGTLAQGGPVSGIVAPAFDGSTGEVVGDSLTLANFTIEAWVYKTASGAAAVVAQGTAGLLEIPFYLRVDGSPSGMTTGSGAYHETTSPTLTLSTWTHVALTYDGANVKTWKNGVTVSTLGATGTPSAGTTNYRVGRLGDYGGGNWFPGRICRAAIYNAALNSTQLLANYNEGLIA